VTDDGRERVAEELRRVREDVRRRALLEHDPAAVLPPAMEARTPRAVPSEPALEPIPLPPPPDGSAVNALWRAEPPPRHGLAGFVARLLERVLAPRQEAQVAWNAKQVQLDNDLLAYVDARFAATHRHYDRVLGQVGRHLGESDERHLILQEELVAHVHDLVKRIDLVLSEGERGRLAHAHALEDVRTRLVRLEERLARG
jgi:hypothetical protein